MFNSDICHVKLATSTSRVHGGSLARPKKIVSKSTAVIQGCISILNTSACLASILLFLQHLGGENGFKCCGMMPSEMALHEDLNLFKLAEPHFCPTIIVPCVNVLNVLVEPISTSAVKIVLFFVKRRKEEWVEKQTHMIFLPFQRRKQQTVLGYNIPKQSRLFWISLMVEHSRDRLLPKRKKLRWLSQCRKTTAHTHIYLFIRGQYLLIDWTSTNTRLNSVYLSYCLFFLLR